jgi:hypothetical protein
MTSFTVSTADGTLSIEADKWAISTSGALVFTVEGQPIAAVRLWSRVERADAAISRQDQPPPAPARSGPRLIPETHPDRAEAIEDRLRELDER